jgi:ribosomal protein S18 acetylase RimI-like enzyme
MEIEIMKATDKYKTLVLVIFTTNDRKNMSYLPDLHTAGKTMDFIGGLIEEGNLYIAIAQGEVAGFIDMKDGWVHHLYIDPAFQNKGIEKHLLDFAKRKFPKGPSLWVFEQNTRRSRLLRARGIFFSSQKE